MMSRRKQQRLHSLKDRLSEQIEANANREEKENDNRFSKRLRRRSGNTTTLPEYTFSVSPDKSLLDGKTITRSLKSSLLTTKENLHMSDHPSPFHHLPKELPLDAFANPVSITIVRLDMCSLPTGFQIPKIQETVGDSTPVEPPSQSEGGCIEESPLTEVCENSDVVKLQAELVAVEINAQIESPLKPNTSATSVEVNASENSEEPSDSTNAEIAENIRRRIASESSDDEFAAAPEEGTNRDIDKLFNTLLQHCETENKTNVQCEQKGCDQGESGPQMQVYELEDTHNEVEERSAVQLTDSSLCKQDTTSAEGSLTGRFMALRTGHLNQLPRSASPPSFTSDEGTPMELEILNGVKRALVMPIEENGELKGTEMLEHDVVVVKKLKMDDYSQERDLEELDSDSNIDEWIQRKGRSAMDAATSIARPSSRRDAGTSISTLRPPPPIFLNSIFESQSPLELQIENDSEVKQGTDEGVPAIQSLLLAEDICITTEKRLSRLQSTAIRDSQFEQEEEEVTAAIEGEKEGDEACSQVLHDNDDDNIQRGEETLVNVDMDEDDVRMVENEEVIDKVINEKDGKMGDVVEAKETVKGRLSSKGVNTGPSLVAVEHEADFEESPMNEEGKGDRDKSVEEYVVDEEVTLTQKYFGKSSQDVQKEGETSDVADETILNSPKNPSKVKPSIYEDDYDTPLLSLIPDRPLVLAFSPVLLSRTETPKPGTGCGKNIVSTPEDCILLVPSQTPRSGKYKEDAFKGKFGIGEKESCFATVSDSPAPNTSAAVRRRSLFRDGEDEEELGLPHIEPEQHTNKGRSVNFSLDSDTIPNFDESIVPTFDRRGIRRDSQALLKQAINASFAQVSGTDKEILKVAYTSFLESYKDHVESLFFLMIKRHSLQETVNNGMDQYCRDQMKLQLAEDYVEKLVDKLMPAKPSTFMKELGFNPYNGQPPPAEAVRLTNKKRASEEQEETAGRESPLKDVQ